MFKSQTTPKAAAKTPTMAQVSPSTRASLSRRSVASAAVSLSSSGGSKSRPDYSCSPTQVVPRQDKPSGRRGGAPAGGDGLL